MKWWRRITGQSTSTGVASDDATGPRRREHERLVARIPLQARCGTWPRVLELFTGDLSAGGVYVPTTHPATLGDKVELTLELPDGRQVAIGGEVASVVDAADAVRLGRPQGIGIRFAERDGSGKDALSQLIQIARASQPRPSDSTVAAFATVAPGMSTAGTALPGKGAGEVLVPRHGGSVVQKLVVPPPSGAAPAGNLFDDPTPAPPRTTPPLPPRAPNTSPAGVGRDPIVGIDLGTCYTAVAAARGSKIAVLPFQGGVKSLASVIAYPTDRETLVGAPARARILTDPKHTVVSPKRLLGRRPDDPEIQGWLGQAPYRTPVGPDGHVMIEIWNRELAIPQLVGRLFQEARDAAEAALGMRVKRCVLTTPVTFDDDRLKLLRRSAQLAGLEVVATIDEPSAAALANRHMPGFGGIVGVYDFGGGTFDFSIVDVAGGDFKVLATAGDSWLGGDDFDVALAEVVARRIFQEHQLDVQRDAVSWQKVLFAAEQAKRALSNEDVTVLTVPQLIRTPSGVNDYVVRVDRASFDKVVSGVIERSITTCREALDLVDLQPSSLTSVFLSGGTTYIPAVRRALAAAFGIPIRTGVPPDHAVVLGAGIHAAQLELQGWTTL